MLLWRHARSVEQLTIAVEDDQSHIVNLDALEQAAVEHSINLRPADAAAPAEVSDWGGDDVICHADAFRLRTGSLITPADSPAQ